MESREKNRSGKIFCREDPESKSNGRKECQDKVF